MSKHFRDIEVDPINSEDKLECLLKMKINIEANMKQAGKMLHVF